MKGGPLSRESFNIYLFSVLSHFTKDDLREEGGEEESVLPWSVHSFGPSWNLWHTREQKRKPTPLLEVYPLVKIRKYCVAKDYFFL